ncbi:hypothetical protein DI396_01800 [Litorivita pollutaquae]|uniref:Uncharacterized protein n=1 Tax=Litorivita pollutaquae TaxID=2200892 RepID=A0A2V4NFU3_9RHOB|nr:hypothetical protein DI396_01800 [Litorivita pollutaquae]
MTTLNTKNLGATANLTPTSVTLLGIANISDAPKYIAAKAGARFSGGTTTADRPLLAALLHVGSAA